VKKKTQKGRHLFTSESVTEGHPDKISDQISDGILDAMLEQDPFSRVACETLVTTGLVLVAGEITSKAHVDITDIVRGVVHSVGYVDASYGFDADTCAVIVSLKKQSPDISQGVTATKDHEQGAGDQGMMFGYANTDTPELMPMPIALSHRITRRLAEVRKDGTCSFLRPDGKAQVTVEYEGSKPVRVDTVVVSSQHCDDITHEDLQSRIIEHVIKPCIPPELLDESNVTYHVNPTGRFVVGGPHGDCGLTGRKIIVDTAPRRRRLLGQGSEQGRPLRDVHGALHSEERGGGRSGRPVPGAARLRHRRGAARGGADRDRRNRQRVRPKACRRHR